MATSEDASTILLLDNGSLEPDSIRSLRGIAASLSRSLARPVEPVSLLHSNKVPAERIDGRPAEVFESAIVSRAEKGRDRFVVIPLFIGPSRAITEYIPERIASIRLRFPNLEVKVAPTLAKPGDAASMDRLAAMLEDGVRERLPGLAGAPSVIVVDHGSPVRSVVDVRNRVAERLQVRLGKDVLSVTPASMERRSGAEFDFCEPLLKRVLDHPDLESGTAILAMLFVSPGRHAGPKGDIDGICSRAVERLPTLSLIRTGLLGTHPDLIGILADRYREGLSAPSTGTGS